MTIENLAAADDDVPFFSPDQNIRMDRGYCFCQGTCSTPADIDFETVQDGTGGPAVVPITGTVECEPFTVESLATNFTGSGVDITGRDSIRFDVVNAVSPETDIYQVCATYTIR